MILYLSNFPSLLWQLWRSEPSFLSPFTIQRIIFVYVYTLPWWLRQERTPAMWETWVRSLGWEDPLEEGMPTYCSLLAWRIPHGQRSLPGYSPWGHKESVMTEQLSTQCIHCYIFSLYWTSQIFILSLFCLYFGKHLTELIEWDCSKTNKQEN